MTGLSVDANGVVLKANLGTDGTITMVDPLVVTNPAPTKSLGQAHQDGEVHRGRHSPQRRPRRRRRMRRSRPLRWTN